MGVAGVGVAGVGGKFLPFVEGESNHSVQAEYKGCLTLKLVGSLKTVLTSSKPGKEVSISWISPGSRVASSVAEGIVRVGCGGCDGGAEEGSARAELRAAREAFNAGPGSVEAVETSVIIATRKRRRRRRKR